jgi:hypothetical protein
VCPQAYFTRVKHELSFDIASDTELKFPLFPVSRFNCNTATCKRKLILMIIHSHQRKFFGTMVALPKLSTFLQFSTRIGTCYASCLLKHTSNNLWICSNVFLYCSLTCHQHIYYGPGSSVGIATNYGLDGPGIESRWGRNFSHTSRPALGPTQPPVQWVSGFTRGKSAGAWCWTAIPSLALRLRMSRAISLLLL